MNDNLIAKNKIKSCFFTFPIRTAAVTVSGNFLVFREYLIDLKPKLVLPITFNPVLDETLNTAQIVLSDMRQEEYEKIDVTTAFEPGTKVHITFEDEKGKKQTTEIFMIISRDDCRLQRKDNSPWKSYKHTIHLVELTKELERLSVDTLTFTNPVPRVYDADADASWNIV